MRSVQNIQVNSRICIHNSPLTFKEFLDDGFWMLVVAQRKSRFNGDAGRSEVHPVKPMGLFCLTGVEIPPGETGGSFIPIFQFKPLLIRALKFRQDHRIKKIFLPFRKKGKKHNPSSREGVQSLYQQHGKARGKAPVIGSSALFFVEAELCFLGFIWKS